MGHLRIVPKSQELKFVAVESQDSGPAFGPHHHESGIRILCGPYTLEVAKNFDETVLLATLDVLGRHSC